MHFNADNFIKFRCGYCGEANITEVDISAGLVQEYIEDCQVCCRPNNLKIVFGVETKSPRVEVVYDG